MTRAVKRLIAAGAAAALLGGVYALLLTHPAPSEKDGTTASLTSIDTEDVTNIAVSLRSGEEFSVRCTSDDTGTSYSMRGDKNGAYDQEELSSLLDTVCAVSGTVVDAEETDLADYGLSDEDEVDRITVTQDEDTKTTLLFGLHSDALDGVYCRTEDSTDVVFVSSTTADTLLRPQSDYLSLRVLHTYYSLSSDLNRVTVNALSDGTTLTIERRDTSGLEEDQTSAYSDFVITAPKSCDADDDALSDGILGDLQSGLTAESIAVRKADSDDLAEYGLDNPVSEITLVFENDEDTVLVGKTVGDTTYVMRDGDKTIFACASDSFAFLNEDWTEYRSTKLLAFAKSQLTRAKLTDADGTTHTAKLKYVPADENEDSDTDTMTGTLSGEDLSSEEIDRLYTALTTLYAVTVRDTPVDAGTMMTLTVKLTDGTSHTVSLAKGGSREYFADVDGSGYRYTLSQSDIDALLDAFGLSD